MADRLIRIAVDAMGGDDYPDILVEGSLMAVKDFNDIEIILVGDENIVGESLNRISSSEKSKKAGLADPEIIARLRIHHSEQIIGMDESPAMAIRSKKNSSLVVANQLCKAGEASAVISAGNTGAAMAASLLCMGRLAGVSRPAITALFPSKKNFVAVLDMGANTDCKPEHLYQFGVMASVYMSLIHGYKEPKVAILNIGEERSKGNELTEGAYSLFEKSDLNFVGNIEGRDIFNGDVDVIVCDGFVGNVLLKFGESVFGFFTHFLKKNISKNISRKIGAYLVTPAIREIKVMMSAEDFGGAPLLGVDGISIICHGNSSNIAIKNAIKVARKHVLAEVNEKIKHEIARKTA